jgi:LPS-assembly protein
MSVRSPAVALALAALALAAAAPAQAQTTPGELLEIDRSQPVALVADAIAFDEAARTLTASGDVEVYYGERVLRARAITYDETTGRIAAEGPLTLDDGQGSTLIADAAALDADLRNGVIEGARALIADGAGTMAAVEGRRIDGRYTLLSRTVYSSCEVCAAQPTPVWRIRARRVLHDEVTRDIHYEDAYFDVLGVPVGYLPYFRHPDPSVERRSGFLTPTFQQDDTYGFAARIPYFWAIDPSRDATFTAYPTTRDGFIGETEYRQAFDFGAFSLTGSAGFLDFQDGEGDSLRGHLFGTGRFAVDAFAFEQYGLRPVSTLGFDVAVTSDDGYLRRYDFTDDDRLSSELFLQNYGARDFFDVAAVYFQSLRDDEPDGQTPVVLPEFSLRRGLDDPLAGGEIGLFASGLGLARSDGRDVARLSVGVDWERRWVLDFGATLRGFAVGRADLYQVDDDPDLDGSTTRLAPQAGLDMRYPLVAVTETATHFLEPGAQLVIAPNGLENETLPNEDSVLVEFDDTNIFDLNRFSGVDRVEGGARLNMGLRYARANAMDGVDVDAMVGRVLRLSDQNEFSDRSGLSERFSDWVGAWSVDFGDTFGLTNRVRIDDSFDFARNEIGARVDWGRLEAQASYVFLSEDPAAGADDDREEVAVDADFRIAPQWTVGGFARRDLQEGRFVRTRARVEYRSECASILAYVGRDFTRSEDNPPSTSVGVQLRLFGLADGAGRRSGLCPAP